MTDNFETLLKKTKDNATVIPCGNPWYYYLYTEEKTVEGRKKSITYEHIKEDDIVLFKLSGDVDNEKYKDIPTSFYARVIGVNKYSTLRQYLETEGVHKCLPGKTTIYEGVNVYTSLMKTTEEEINKIGFMGIHVKKINEYLD